MNKLAKSIGVLLLMMVFAMSCTKPEEPSNGGNNDDNDTVSDYGFVDLGLPSGTLWATCNLGADTPEDFGDYYAWGETEPKELYDWKSYKYGRFFHERYELNKYCTDSIYGFYGFVDHLTLLDLEDDVARACWGGGWRMPTIEEWDEMFQNTTSVWTTRNGVRGWRFTASNGNSLFLPAAGYYWNGELNAVDLGVYWSVTLNMEYPYRAWGFHFNAFQCHLCGSSDRNRGQTVRAVCSVK